MKAFLTVHGERSVGIRDLNITIDVEGVPVENFLSSIDAGETKYKTGREFFRARLQQFWGNFLDTRPAVRFEDECPDCGRRLTEKKCSNKNCISKMEEKP
jgi:hypothetical protein